MPAAMTSTTKGSLTDVLFDNLPLSSETHRALREMRLTNCTQVQAASLPVCLAGTDVACKAKTGTGKTVAFLIPAIERLKQRQPQRTRGLISILVISPTRELASQIAVEAEKLVQHHNLGVQVIVGGGRKPSADASSLERNTPQILVATPGRLWDLLSNFESVAPRLRSLQTLVFDEADRLLDMGFRPDITRILSALPPKTGRQTMLFSATYPPNIQELCKFALRQEFQLVDTVGEAETQTAEKIKQSLMVTSMEDQIANLAHILKRHQEQEKQYKVMVFFTTARLTGLYAAIFEGMGVPILELHSRKSQTHRTRVADSFRAQKRVILFSSDVSARGVDYPDVTLVVQVGLPESKDQYIHRVGRTARAGKGGSAVLLLQDYESKFRQQLKGLPVSEIAPPSADELASIHVRADRAIAAIEPVTIAQGYQAWLGFYNTYKSKLGFSSETLVEYANYFACEVLGQELPPALEAKTVGKMGLKNVPGIRLVPKGGGGGAVTPGKRRNNPATKPAPVQAGGDERRGGQEPRQQGERGEGQARGGRGKRPRNGRQQQQQRQHSTASEPRAGFASLDW